MDYDILKRKPSELKHIKPAFSDGYNKALRDINSIRDVKINRQESVVSKIIYEMISYNLISEHNAIQVRQYLIQLYSVGLNDGGVVHAHGKTISSFDKNGVAVKTYPSAAHAARELKVCKSGISRAAVGKQPTCAGYFWKYEKI